MTLKTAFDTNVACFTSFFSTLRVVLLSGIPELHKHPFFPSFPQVYLILCTILTYCLLLQGLLDNEGSPQFLTGIVTHLGYHEPGNLAFVFLMKSGALRKLCQITNGKVSIETQINLMIVLSYLFAPLQLHEKAKKQKHMNSKVILPPLPPHIRKVRIHTKNMFLSNALVPSCCWQFDNSKSQEDKLE